MWFGRREDIVKGRIYRLVYVRRCRKGIRRMGKDLEMVLLVKRKLKTRRLLFSR